MDKVFIKDYNKFDFSKIKNCIVVSPFLPASIISKLKKNGCVYVKANSLEEIEGLEVKTTKEKRIKRGVGCGGKFNG